MSTREFVGNSGNRRPEPPSFPAGARGIELEVSAAPTAQTASQPSFPSRRRSPRLPFLRACPRGVRCRRACTLCAPRDRPVERPIYFADAGTIAIGSELALEARRKSPACNLQQLPGRHVAEYELRRWQFIPSDSHLVVCDDFSPERTQIRRQSIRDALRTAASQRPANGVGGDAQHQSKRRARHALQRQHGMRRQPRKQRARRDRENISARSRTRNAWRAVQTGPWRSDVVAIAADFPARTARRSASPLPTAASVERTLRNPGRGSRPSRRCRVPKRRQRHRPEDVPAARLDEPIPIHVRRAAGCEKRANPHPWDELRSTTSWTNPGKVSAAERAPPPMVSCASSTSTERPVCATVIAAANPFGPEPTTMASYSVWLDEMGTLPTMRAGDSCQRAG